MKKLINTVIEKIKVWYKGKYIPPPEYDPYSRLAIPSAGDYKQPYLAKILKIIGIFWLNHWKWIITTCIGIIVIYLTFIRQ